MKKVLAFEAFLINLDRDSDRLAWSNIQLTEIGIQYNRVSAVDMNQLRTSENDLVTLGVKACWESHKKTLQQFLEGDSEFALILEDDVQFMNFRKIRKMLQKAPWQEFDVYQVGFLSHGILAKASIHISNLESIFFKVLSIFLNASGAKLKARNRMRVKQASRMPFGMVAARFEAGTHCYFISRHAATVVLSLNNPQFLSADDFFSALARMRSLKFGRPSKSLADQKNFPKFPGPRFNLEN